ncbi:hypothetical protein [Salana multivorans]
MRADEHACVLDPGQDVEAQLAALHTEAGAVVSPADLPHIAVELANLMGEHDDETAVRCGAVRCGAVWCRLRVARELLVEVNQSGRPRGVKTATTGEGGR